MTEKINKSFQLSPLGVFFITFSLEFCSDYLKLPRPLSDVSGQDAWIGILISGICSLVALLLIFRLLENEQSYGQADLYSIHRRLFGKWIGSTLNLIVLAQIMFYVVHLIRTYTELYQVWLLPNLSPLEFAVIIFCIAGYVVMGGIRTICGLALLYFIYMIPFFQTLNFSVPYLHFANLLPIADHSWSAILEASYFGSKLFLGFDLIVFYYPFISQPGKAKKWAFFGVLTGLCIYLNLTIVGTAFATQGALNHTIWPLLSLFKTLQIPFFNHAEKLATLFFVWSLVPNICMYIWIVVRGSKSIFPAFKQKYILIVVLLLGAGLSLIITNGNQIRMMGQLAGTIGVIVAYLYLPFLLICQRFLKKSKGRKKAA
ncbi:MAG: spore germination protein [Sporolactobacillus sp.]|jgi:spore germination protein (amino acid permease)|nr:spore germination protein [Sporolactobacillus sp.]